MFGFLLQADNDDAYLIEYRDGSSSAWLTAWLSPTYAVQPGVTTRPAGADRPDVHELAAPILVSEFRISAPGGDGSYSVSEFQAFSQASTVPEAGTVLLLATGLAGLGAVTLRRRRVQG